MTAVTQDLSIEQGATFTLGFNWYREALPATVPPTAGEAYDLTGASARMQIRKTQQSSVLVEALSDGTPAFITLGTTDGRVDIRIPGVATNMLVNRAALYDLEIVLAAPLPSGEPDVRRLMSGAVAVSPNITQIVGEPVVGA